MIGADLGDVNVLQSASNLPYTGVCFYHGLEIVDGHEFSFIAL